MYASAGPEGSSEPLRFFGPLGYAKRDTTAKRVVKVQVVPTDEPQPEDYWAWLDAGALEPCHVAATEAAMTTAFKAGEDPEGPRDYESRGQGQILRLQVTVLPEEVYLRSGRSNWRISSAM
jgi:hypothetical protein